MLSFVNVARFVVSTARRVLTASILGAGDPGDDASAERVDGCEVAQPLGLFAQPAVTANTEALIARMGDEVVILAVVDKSRPAQNVEAGETRLYGVGASNAATVIRLRNDGSIEITAKSGASVSINVDGAGDVVLDGGSLKAARVTDPVNVAVITATAGPYPVTFSTALVNASGVPGVPTVGATATISGVIASSGGAAHVKA